MEKKNDFQNYEKIRFTPQWKEIMLCEYNNHNFILEYPMGIPTLYLPNEQQWKLIAPDWAKEIYNQLETDAIEYCKNNKINLEKSESNYFFFDHIEYKILQKNGYAISIGNESYIIKTSDGNHEIFLRQESDSPSFDERNQTILIDGKKLEVIFTDVYIAQDENIENIFFGCIGKDNIKKFVAYNFNKQKLYYFPDYIHNFYIENEYIKGFDDKHKDVQYNYLELIKNT